MSESNLNEQIENLLKEMKEIKENQKAMNEKMEKMQEETPEFVLNKFRHDINCLSDSVNYRIINIHYIEQSNSKKWS